MTEIFEEETWEAEITAALSGLGSVEPPPGFLSQAVNHRPLFAGRLTAGVLALAGLAFAGAAAAGILAPTEVVPELASLTAQHNRAAAAGLTGSSTNTPDVDLPAGFDLKGTVELEDSQTSNGDVEQSLYSSGGAPVSVFTQRGDVDFSNLPHEGRRSIDGSDAWVSDGVLIVESGNDAVTIIGLPEGTLQDVLASLGGNGGTVGRATDVMGALLAQIGFADPR